MIARCGFAVVTIVTIVVVATCDCASAPAPQPQSGNVAAWLRVGRWTCSGRTRDDDDRSQVHPFTFTLDIGADDDGAGAHGNAVDESGGGGPLTMRIQEGRIALTNRDPSATLSVVSTSITDVQLFAEGSYRRDNGLSSPARLTITRTFTGFESTLELHYDSGGWTDVFSDTCTPRYE